MHKKSSMIPKVKQQVLVFTVIIPILCFGSVILSPLPKGNIYQKQKKYYSTLPDLQSAFV